MTRRVAAPGPAPAPALARVGAVLLGLLLPVAVRGQTVDTAYQNAVIAWERGEYPTALRGFLRLLDGAGGERYLERIAILTGELYHTRELTTDGRAVHFDPSGQWVSFETGAGATRMVHVMRRDGSAHDSLAGSGAAFLPAAIAVLRASDAEGRRARIVVRDLASHAERALGDSAVRWASIATAPDGGTLYAIGKRSDQTGSDVYAIAVAGGTTTRVTTTDGMRSDLAVLPGGKHLLYFTGRDPFAPPGRGGRGGGGGGGRGGAVPERGFVVRDLATGAERAFTGLAPSAAADGTTLVYLDRRGTESSIVVVPLAGGDPVTVKKTTDGIDVPALSPDGKTVVFQMMTREDWELHLIDASGQNERRLTHEIQHDLLPRYLAPSRILAVMGEARHRRSYLYDATTGARTRLFHNNTIRTIAPEYEWVPSADGSAVAIVAERDGDTVSPERGVYVMDLSSTVTKAELSARLRASLAAEVALRERGARMFAPIASQVRARTDSVSMERLFGYQRDLFQFDSKFVTRPGNAQAIAYLESAYRGFGYQPTRQEFEARGAKTANVVAVLRGSVSPDVTYVVGSHFDSVDAGPGSDDDTSGTAMLLETARLLAGHPLPATLIFVSFTGEEAGLLGSREFVRRLVADSVHLAGAMNNDMIGWSNDQRLDNTIRYSNAGIRDVQHAAALGFSKLITYDAVYYKSTDAASFYDAYGDVVGGFGSYPVLGNPHYHQKHDVLETINQELVTETTRANVATIMYLASSPSRLVGLSATREAAGDVTIRWRPSPEKDVHEYLVAWNGTDGAERSLRVREPSARIPASRVASAREVRVKAVNVRGLEGWDWARVVPR